jgi:hypothetical protein
MLSIRPQPHHLNRRKHPPHQTASQIAIQPPAELSNSTRAALAAAAAELQAQAAAAAGRPMRPDDLSSNGCPPCAPGGAGCAGGARGALAPPGARCVPRGESYFIGCQLGLMPVRSPASRAALGAHGGFGYWRQLLRFAAWMAAVWLAWLLVLMAVTLAMRTGPGDAVSGLLGYLRVRSHLCLTPLGCPRCVHCSLDLVCSLRPGAGSAACPLPHARCPRA